MTPLPSAPMAGGSVARRRCVHHWVLGSLVDTASLTRRERSHEHLPWKRILYRWGQCKKCDIRRKLPEREFPVGGTLAEGRG